MKNLVIYLLLLFSSLSIGAERNMELYQVRILAENYLLNENGVEGKYGVLTVKFVNAQSGNDAGKVAQELLSTQLEGRALNEKGNEPKFTIEEVLQVKEVPEKFTNGQMGLIIFPTE